jgi:hypothetical protein
LINVRVVDFDPRSGLTQPSLAQHDPARAPLAPLPTSPCAPLLLSLSHLDFPRSNLPLPLPPLSPRGALGFGVEITGIWILEGEFSPPLPLPLSLLPLPFFFPSAPSPAPGARAPAGPVPAAPTPGAPPPRPPRRAAPCPRPTPAARPRARARLAPGAGGSAPARRALAEPAPSRAPAPRPCPGGCALVARPGGRARPAVGRAPAPATRVPRASRFACLRHA